MVHFYRAAPQPKNETETYIMYGLVAIAIILGLFYLYRRNRIRRNNSSPSVYPSSSPSSYPSVHPSSASSVSQELYGTSWKFYGQPDSQPDVLHTFLTFGSNNKGNATSAGFLTDIEYSPESQMIRGKKGPEQRNMKYHIVEEESIDDPKKMEKILIIDNIIGDKNIPYKLSFVPPTPSPTTGITSGPSAAPAAPTTGITARPSTAPTPGITTGPSAAPTTGTTIPPRRA